MTMKRLLALLIAVLMMVTLFSACANDKDDDTAKKDDAATSTDKKDDDKKEDDAKEETPEEVDPYEITYMGSETHNWSYTYDEAVAKGFETIRIYNEKMLEEQNLIVNLDIIDNESYKTTLSGYLAAGTLDDAFISKGNMDEDVLLNASLGGQFADINDIIPYSDGAFSSAVEADNGFKYLKAWNVAPDGGWYYMGCADGNGTALNLDNAEYDYMNNWPLHTWYTLQIRVDWLNKCGLAMPTTVEEFHQALVAFQQNDANGNGAQDERAFLGIGMSSEQVFGHQTAGWFGLPPRNFYMSAATGEIENPVDFGDQYIAFVEYTAGLYADSVAYINEGGAWAYGANVAGNYAAAQIMYPDNLITVQTGDPDTQYEPLPVIQALEGVKPRYTGQSVQTANNGLSFKADVELEAAAAYLDWLSSPTLYMMLCYGIEGETYDLMEDGRVYQYTVGEGADISQEHDESYGDMWHYAPWSMFPQFQAGFLCDPVQNVYNGVQEALDNNEPYYWKNLTLDDWKVQYANYNWTEMSNLNRWFLYMTDFGTDNILFDLNVNFTTMATEDENAVTSALGTDLTTYLAEMTTKYITGEASTDTYEADLAYAYDTLGMQEYVDALQAQADRYLVALGREPILG